MITDNEYYLITANNWFYGPDGESYRAVWGKAKVFEAKTVFGINPIRSTNWFMKVGEGDKSVLMAGCQIHYAMRCDKRPTIKEGTYARTDQTQLIPLNNIWLTE